MWRTSSGTYGPTAKIFHWLLFLLLAAQYAVGAIMPHIGRKTLDQGWVHWHLLVGAAILVAIVLRFLWRLFHPVAPAGNLTRWEAWLSYVTHLTLYALVFVMAVLGWAAANYRGWDVVPLPALAAKGTPWAHRAGGIHNILVYVLLGVIALHVVGALYHYFIKRDDVLRRILSGPKH